MTREQSSNYFWRDGDWCNPLLAADEVRKCQSKIAELNSGKLVKAKTRVDWQAEYSVPTAMSKR